MSHKQEVDLSNGNRGKGSGTVKRVLTSLAVIVVAVFPFPWW